MIMNESEMIRSIKHSNILRLMCVLTIEDEVVLVTNFVDGANLATLIFSEESLCDDDKLFIALQICEALRFCHSIPLVHRDIKPANILVDGTTKHVFLADFGLTRVLTTAGTTTRTSAKGTPGFQAPEVLKASAGQLTTAADMYSLGCVLIEVFTGCNVWSTLTPVQIICKVVAEGARPNAAGVSLQYIRDVCVQCTSTLAVERPSAETVMLTLIKNAPHVAARLVQHAFQYTSE